MKLLIADDDAFFRKMLERVLAPSYELVMAVDGAEAWQIIQQPDGPRLAILDWVMPKFTGPQLCRKVRETASLRSMYMIILTAKDSSSLTAALRAGADDYVTKPFDAEELRARVRVGQRIIDLQTELMERASVSENDVSQSQQLRALLPVCPHCGKVRVDKKYWHDLEIYLRQTGRHPPQNGECAHCLQEGIDPAFELSDGI